MATPNKDDKETKKAPVDTAEKKKRRSDDLDEVDRAARDSFPASDPPSWWS